MVWLCAEWAVAERAREEKIEEFLRLWVSSALAVRGNLALMLSHRPFWNTRASGNDQHRAATNPIG